MLGNIRPASEILACIRYILNDATPRPDYPLGLMTSQDRDTWTTVRKQLVDSGISGVEIINIRVRIGNNFSQVCPSVCLSVCSGYNF